MIPLNGESDIWLMGWGPILYWQVSHRILMLRLRILRLGIISFLFGFYAFCLLLFFFSPHGWSIFPRHRYIITVITESSCTFTKVSLNYRQHLSVSFLNRVGKKCHRMSLNTPCHLKLLENNVLPSVWPFTKLKEHNLNTNYCNDKYEKKRKT